MEIEIAKKYRVIDASRFEDEHGIKNGHEFFVDSLDDDGDIWSRGIAWNGIDGDSRDAPHIGWALLMKGHQDHSPETPADYSGAIEQA